MELTASAHKRTVVVVAVESFDLACISALSVRTIPDSAHAGPEWSKPAQDVDSIPVQALRLTLDQLHGLEDLLT